MRLFRFLAVHSAGNVKRNSKICILRFIHRLFQFKTIDHSLGETVSGIRTYV